MTLEEAKKLKPGDKVLVEAEVTYPVTGYPRTHHISSRGNVGLKTPIICDHPIAHWMVAPEAIRKKIEPRRKCKKGDIVFFGNRLFFVASDGDEKETEIFLDGDYYWVRNSEIKFICAAEDCADRKEGAA